MPFVLYSVVDWEDGIFDGEFHAYSLTVTAEPATDRGASDLLRLHTAVFCVISMIYPIESQVSY